MIARCVALAAAGAAWCGGMTTAFLDLAADCAGAYQAWVSGPRVVARMEKLRLAQDDEARRLLAVALLLSEYWRGFFVGMCAGGVLMLSALWVGVWLWL